MYHPKFDPNRTMGGSVGGKEESQGRGRRQGGSTGDWRKACGGSSQARQRHVKEYHKDRVGKEGGGSWKKIISPLHMIESRGRCQGRICKISTTAGVF